MTIEPVSSCPEWCDPRAHIQHDRETPEHRTAGMTWKPNGADTQITVAEARLDDLGLFGHTGQVRVTLRIVEECPVDGTDGIAETDLDPSDARMLAAALVCTAERIEALQRRAVNR